MAARLRAGVAPSRRRLGAGGPGGAIVVALAMLAFVALLPAAAAAPVAPASVSTATFLNVSATESLSFVPDTLTVEPGEAVHLEVTQLADFNHTFTLSPVANYTFPTSDTTADLDTFFAAHTPLVNLTLGSTMGLHYYRNFTAPSQGSYEYVCLESGHFAAGMHGELDSGLSAASSSGPSTTELYAGVTAVVIVLVVAVAILVTRRRGRAPPPPP